MRIIRENRGFAFAVPTVLLVVVALWWFDNIKVYPPTYCPEPTVPQTVMRALSPGHTVILVDTSNEVSREDGARADALIDEWTKNDTAAPFLQRLSVYSLPQQVDDLGGPHGEPMCIPKEGDEYSWLYENQTMVQAHFLNFLSQLKAVFWDTLGKGEADQSPLVETMARLMEQHADIDSFVLVSDMLQHTPIWSHYRKTGDLGAVEATCDQIRALGRLKKVYVYYIDRELPTIQASAWPDEWWANCLAGVGTEMLNGT